MSDSGCTHGEHVSSVQDFLPRTSLVKKVVKMPEKKRLPCPFPFLKDQPVQNEVGENHSTGYMLKSAQIALKAVGKMSLPSLGTVLSLNTSLTLRLRTAFWKIRF